MEKSQSGVCSRGVVHTPPSQVLAHDPEFRNVEGIHASWSVLAVLAIVVSVVYFVHRGRIATGSRCCPSAAAKSLSLKHNMHVLAVVVLRACACAEIPAYLREQMSHGSRRCGAVAATIRGRCFPRVRGRKSASATV